MASEVKFEQLTTAEKKLLLKAFDYEIDSTGSILTPSGSKIPSEEQPGKFLNIETAAFIPGSLKVIDGTPTAISKFIREKLI